MTDIAKPHIEIDGKPAKKLSDKHLALVRRGAELTRLIKDQKTELDKVNDQLKKDLGPGVSIVVPEEVRVPIAESISQAIGNVDGLKKELGTRKFNLMVTTNTTFKPTAVLLDLASECKDIADCLTEKTSVSVKYLPIKTQK